MYQPKIKDWLIRKLWWLAKRQRKKLESLIAEVKEEDLARIIRVLEALVH